MSTRQAYRTIEKGRNIYKFIHIPKEFIDLELEIEVKPVKKRKFSEFLTDSYSVKAYKHFTREEINEV